MDRAGVARELQRPAQCLPCAVKANGNIAPSRPEGGGKGFPRFIFKVDATQHLGIVRLENW